MSVYTVHEPPLRAADAIPDPERFVFVRDRFSVWAFLFTPLWMLWHRMWLVLVGYVVVSAGLETAMVAFGASAMAVALVGVLVSLLIGLEASTLRRLTLSFGGWRNIGIVSAADLEDAERRFFETWLEKVRSPISAAAPSPVPRVPRSSGVTGLFPEPGANR